ncbi:hypothetical protein IV203_000270 [Nitzschia inconspicua]|uniref:Uncharacterized protein n=1 Tax=Nitzschia inconspicua TaxID=303405 RepID=A0A9K3L596_9STRA|nr:hypothetical protein IV203_000270 [Nitzschia inconspicua]
MGVSKDPLRQQCSQRMSTGSSDGYQRTCSHQLGVSKVVPCDHHWGEHAGMLTIKQTWEYCSEEWETSCGGRKRQPDRRGMFPKGRAILLAGDSDEKLAADTLSPNVWPVANPRLGAKRYPCVDTTSGLK